MLLITCIILITLFITGIIIYYRTLNNNYSIVKAKSTLYYNNEYEEDIMIIEPEIFIEEIIIDEILEECYSDSDDSDW